MAGGFLDFGMPGATWGAYYNGVPGAPTQGSGYAYQQPGAGIGAFSMGQSGPPGFGSTLGYDANGNPGSLVGYNINGTPYYRQPTQNGGIGQMGGGSIFFQPPGYAPAAAPTTASPAPAVSQASSVNVNRNAPAPINNYPVSTGSNPVDRLSGLLNSGLVGFAGSIPYGSDAPSWYKNPSTTSPFPPNFSPGPNAIDPNMMGNPGLTYSDNNPFQPSPTMSGSGYTPRQPSGYGVPQPGLGTASMFPGMPLQVFGPSGYSYDPRTGYSYNPPAPAIASLPSPSGGSSLWGTGGGAWGETGDWGA